MTATQVDKNTLLEHEFYESGNLKNILPMIKSQTYQEQEQEFNLLNIYGFYILLISCIIVFAFYLKQISRVKKSQSIV